MALYLFTNHFSLLDIIVGTYFGVLWLRITWLKQIILIDLAEPRVREQHRAIEMNKKPMIIFLINICSRCLSYASFSYLLLQSKYGLLNAIISISYNFFWLVMERNMLDFLFWLKLKLCFTVKIWTSNSSAHLWPSWDIYFHDFDFKSIKYSCH